jgi:hypothetical protein
MTAPTVSGVCPSFISLNPTPSRIGYKWQRLLEPSSHPPLVVTGLFAGPVFDLVYDPFPYILASHLATLPSGVKDIKSFKSSTF